MLKPKSGLKQGLNGEANPKRGCLGLQKRRGFCMWYVIWCESGKECGIARQIQERVPKQAYVTPILEEVGGKKKSYVVKASISDKKINQGDVDDDFAHEYYDENNVISEADFKTEYKFINNIEDVKNKLSIDQPSLCQVYSRCFVPMREMNYRIRGEWSVKEKSLYNGYIFVNTENIERFHCFCKSEIDGFNMILKTGHEYSSLRVRDANIIDTIFKEDDIIRNSKGVREGDRVVIVGGPLMDLKTYISKVDFHRRKVYIKIPMFGGLMETSVGLELIKKLEDGTYDAKQKDLIEG